MKIWLTTSEKTRNRLSSSVSFNGVKHISNNLQIYDMSNKKANMDMLLNVSESNLDELEYSCLSFIITIWHQNGVKIMSILFVWIMENLYHWYEQMIFMKILKKMLKNSLIEQMKEEKNDHDLSRKNKKCNWLVGRRDRWWKNYKFPSNCT